MKSCRQCRDLHSHQQGTSKFKKLTNASDRLNFKFKMLAKDGKKEPKIKKATNLRIFDILNEQAQERSTKKAAHNTSKVEVKGTLKGKKIDNKTLLHQFRQHVDDFPVVLRHPKEPEFFNNNTTLSVTKSNNECQSQGRRPGSSMPFQRRRDDDRRKQSFSICTYELNDPDRPARSKSKSTHKAGHSQLGEDDKENRYSQGRHSLMAGRLSRQRMNHHNRSCNDEELLRRSAKSKTPVSRSKMLEKRQKNNASCIDYLQSRNPGSGEKEKRKRRKSSANLLTKQIPAKHSKKELKKPKHKKTSSEVQTKKRKSLEKQREPAYDPKPRRSLNPSEQPTVIRKKKSINLQKQSDQDDYDYPISKYMNVKKKKPQPTNKQKSSKSTAIFTNEFCKKIFTDSSLIKSSVETSKKSSLQYERSYQIPQRITELDDEGTSVKKKTRHEELQEHYSFQFDLEEVRRFEKRQALEKYHKYKLRRPLFKIISQEFPELNQQEIEFLASVIFIQRQWRFIKEKRRIQAQQASQQRNRPASSEQNISDLMRSHQLSQKSVGPAPESALPFSHSKSNRQNKMSHSSSSNSSINDPLYKALVQHKRDELEKRDQIEEIYKSQQVDNPLEKYKTYFKELQSADVSPPKQQSKEELKATSKPVFKKIKRVSEFYNDDQQSTVKIKIPEESKMMAPGDEPLPAHRGNYGVALTQRSDYSKSSINCEKQIFPPLQLISERKHILMMNFTTKIKTLQQQYITQQLDTARFKSTRNELQQTFNQQLNELKTSNKDIQKGYLKYIDFINKIKLQVRKPDHYKTKPTSRLRRVSSEDSLMSRLYSRFCSIESLSNDSSSLKELKKRLLIRKEYVSSEALGIRRSLSRHQLLNNDRYLEKRDLDMSEKIKIDQGESFQKIEQLTEEVQEMRQSADFIPEFVLYDEKQVEVHEISGSMININDFLCRIKDTKIETQSDKDSDLESSVKITQNLKKEENSIYLSDQILQQLIIEFQADIDESRSLTKKIKNRIDKKKRKLPSINCEISGVTDYIDSLFNFLRDSKYLTQVLTNFNTALGYAPYNFLKMLRDPDFLPPEEYIQIVPDLVYIQLERLQLEKLQVANVDPKFTNFLKGISSVHNRVIFEAVKVQLLRLKPYGQEGLPYPWDPEPLFVKKPAADLEDKFKIVRERILGFCVDKCGLLLEKYNIRTAEDLQKAHQQNQQRLLEALEEDIQQDRSWEFINMQLLQTKMDLDTELFNLIMDQLVDQIIFLKQTKF